MRNLFVVIEGLDGTGKSSVADDVAAELQLQGRPAIALHTPEGDYRKITDYISESCKVDAQFLFFLSAVKHASDVIATQLQTSTVVCDRYIYSTVSYHRARGCTVALELDSLGLQQPDCAFYLTIKDEEVRNRRVAERGIAKPGDLLPLKSGLLASIDLQFRQFPLTEIDTTHLLQRDVVAKIIAALR